MERNKRAKKDGGKESALNRMRFIRHIDMKSAARKMARMKKGT